MSNWIGYAVSVNCGDPLGCYQGTILEADGSTITLTKAFRNGFPYPKSQVTLNAADIKELKIIEAASERSQQTHSTVAVSNKAGKKGARATVCENLQANPTNTGNQSSGAGSGASSGGAGGGSRAAGGVRAGGGGGGGGGAGARVQPGGGGGGGGGAGARVQPCGGGSGGGGATPRARDKARRRNEACFGDAADPALADDFDFEGNLALFDKRALWERMRSAKPDLVRHADDKLRPDENVLAAAPGPGRGLAERVALRPPDELRGPLDYVTDSGALVASAAPALRRALWDGLRRLGLLDSAYTLLARAAADVALRLVGGGRRLDARNAHQAPRVTALCGAHRAGAAGLEAARLLASQGARVAAVLPAGAAPPPAARPHLAALAADGARLVEAPAAAPPPDLVLVALHDPQQGAGAGGAAALEAWAAGARCVLALEPAAGGAEGARAAVVALAPPALPASLGRLFLADVAAPRALWAELGVTYRPPFGAASLLPLYAADSAADD